MSEFAPAGRTPKMTKSQVRRYINEMEEKRKKAKEELEKMQKEDSPNASESELKKIENELDDLFFY